MLTCIVNISEGCRVEIVDDIARCAGSSLLDVHSDQWHNRSVLSLGGQGVFDATVRVARRAYALIDLTKHSGVHPRLGAIDVVPFVPVSSYERHGSSDLREALSARGAFADVLARECTIPCFFYGPERSLPQVRRMAFRELAPDVGPPLPNSRAGACCVGARPVLVAYNVWLKKVSLKDARSIARALRSPMLRCLGVAVGDTTQIACNLTDPWVLGPAQAFDAIDELASIDRGELVGLLPADLLATIPAARWSELGVSADKTLESRLAR